MLCGCQCAAVGDKLCFLFGPVCSWNRLFDPRATLSTVSVLCRLPLIVADIVVTAITWSTQHQHARDLHMLGERRSLMGVFLRNGIQYFL
ncbi:hypothetical protein OH77DRAFT_504251 [Trametes cingulata]|nr:hypothetical protein OH77DRAFT_504251 [Trametes cingulata]